MRCWRCRWDDGIASKSSMKMISNWPRDIHSSQFIRNLRKTGQRLHDSGWPEENKGTRRKDSLRFLRVSTWLDLQIFFIMESWPKRNSCHSTINKLLSSAFELTKSWSTDFFKAQCSCSFAFIFSHELRIYALITFRCLQPFFKLLKSTWKYFQSDWGLGGPKLGCRALEKFTMKVSIAQDQERVVVMGTLEKNRHIGCTFLWRKRLWRLFSLASRWQQR